MGSFKVELFQSKAPITVKNFLRYVDEKFYDGTIFHRVIPTFMIQGGGFLPGLKEKTAHEQIKNESTNGLSNERGTIAMARTNRPDSASAQFFVNVVDNLFLDRARAKDGVGYCVFGRVTDGMETVDKIKRVPTRDLGQFEGVPNEDVVIKSIRRVESSGS
jgi:cyclophilin family peptidyl-prolyl cis-trans isomerase